MKIIDLIEMHPDDHDMEIMEAIKENPLYVQAQIEFLEAIDKLEKEPKLLIDDKVCLMETIAIDVAFNEGFKTAIQLILSSVQ